MPSSPRVLPSRVTYVFTDKNAFLPRLPFLSDTPQMTPQTVPDDGTGPRTLRAVRMARLPYAARLALPTDTFAAMLRGELLAALQALSQLPHVMELWVGRWF